MLYQCWLSIFSFLAVKKNEIPYQILFHQLV